MLRFLARLWGMFWALYILGRITGSVVLRRLWGHIKSKPDVNTTETVPSVSDNGNNGHLIDLFLREKLLTEDLSTDLQDLIKDITGDPRVSAITLGSFLENSLAIAIQNRMILLDSKIKKKIFEDDGPLSTMSAKIDVGYSLGIYDKDCRDDLITIARIRNRFAHKVRVRSFDHPEIVTLLSKLRLSKIFRPVKEFDLSNNRTNFTMAVLFAWFMLITEIKSIENRPEQAKSMSEMVDFYKKTTS